MTYDTTAGISLPASSRRPATGRWFYVGMAVFVIIVSMAGFGPSIMDQSRRIAPATPLLIAHGVLVGAWLLLFLTQATLVATRRVALHRRLGVAGVVLAFLMVAVTTAAMIEGARRGHDVSGDIARVFSTPPGVAAPTPPTAEFAAGMFGPLAGSIIWGVLVAAGLWNRRRPEVHRRLMLLSVVYPLGVPLLHLGGVLVSWRPDLLTAVFIASQVIVLATLCAPAIHDRLTRGRVHPVFLWVPAFLVVWEFALVPVVISMDAWREFAAWLFL